MLPYSDDKNEFWAGIYTSRPGAKKEVKDGSAEFHAANKLFALEILKNDLKIDQVTSIVQSKDRMLDALGVYQHHDAITGTDQQFVAHDYSHRLSQARDVSNQLY